MAIDLQQVVNSPFTVRFALVMARAVPAAVGYPASDWIGKWAASRRDSAVTRAVRLNQWMARGAALDPASLDEVVVETLQNNIRDLYDLYHNLEHPETIIARTCLTPLAKGLLKRPEFSGRGMVLAGIHLSSFDSVMMGMAHLGVKCLVLTIPDPQGGRRVEYELRRRTGMNIIPASLDALRSAVQYLERGGLVLTGIDRPIPNPRLKARFFGQPACLPTHHILLALKARVPVVLMAVIRQPDGTYQVLSTEPMEMEPQKDRDAEILENAENVLRQAEGLIRLAPQQWNVPLPVWPELMEKVPG